MFKTKTLRSRFRKIEQLNIVDFELRPEQITAKSFGNYISLWQTIITKLNVEAHVKRKRL